MAGGNQQVRPPDKTSLIDLVMMEERAAGRFATAHAFEAVRAGHCAYVLGKNFGIGQELLETLHAIKNLDQARMMIVERTEHGGPLQFMELGQLLVRAGSATAIGDVQASQRAYAINSLGISTGLIVGRLQIELHDSTFSPMYSA
jgi:hypothetical protein